MIDYEGPTILLAVDYIAVESNVLLLVNNGVQSVLLAVVFNGITNSSHMCCLISYISFVLTIHVWTLKQNNLIYHMSVCIIDNKESRL